MKKSLSLESTQNIKNPYTYANPSVKKEIISLTDLARILELSSQTFPKKITLTRKTKPINRSGPHKWNITSQRTINHEWANQNVTSQDVIDQDLIGQNIASQNLVGQNFFGQELISQDSISQNIISHNLLVFVAHNFIGQNIVGYHFFCQNFELDTILFTKMQNNYSKMHEEKSIAKIT